MAKLRKMLGDINSEECISLMNLIETQSKITLATWAIGYAKRYYLGIYEAECPDDLRFQNIILACEEYLKGNMKLKEIKPIIKEGSQIAREANDNPIVQATARAISTALSTIQTPTSTLGFLFYGAAAVAYSEVGLGETTEVYNKLATVELNRALSSLEEVSIPNEECPVKISWNC
ncbi:putative immunity protein [Clostridium paraputrificum]|uniref:putative immunity protein n=1 Tax=Clostridium TaxID=1485 RepID=UPI003D352241